MPATRDKTDLPTNRAGSAPGLSASWTCNLVEGDIGEPSKEFSYDLLFPSGLSCSYDETEPGYRAMWMASITGDITMATGTVKWFNTSKGFGFIAPASGGKDVFVHISALERLGLTQLTDGQAVTYDLESGRDGRESASNIALA